MILLIFFIISLLIILFLLVDVNSTNYTIVKHNILSQNEVDDLYLLMYQFNNICKNFNIEYFIIGGTLLGSYRHSGLMPWDDDIDIGILDKYQTILESNLFLQYLDKLNIYISKPNEIFFGYKLFIKNTNYPFIDIFIFSEIKNKITFKYENARVMWENEYFYKNELYPLKKYKFGNLSLTGPANAKKYLSRAYGTSCFYVISSTNNHHPNNIKYNKFSLLLNREVVYPSNYIK